ncbi:hypothetical protein Tco_0999682 [Tanacetum coccineum]
MHKEHVSKQGRKYTKGESSVQGNPLFDELHEDSVEHMETNDAQDEGRTREMVDEEKEIEKDMLSTDDVLGADKEKVSTDKEKVSTDRTKVSTDDSKVSTDRQKVSTDDSKVSTDRQKVSSDEQEQGTEGNSQVTQTPAAEIFKDDETIAKVLLNMSQAKAVLREKEKGVEFREIDPKDKGKKKIVEEDESESEDDDIPQAVKKFKQLESDEELARKIQEEWEAEEARIRAEQTSAEKLQEQEREQFNNRRKSKVPS